MIHVLAAAARNSRTVTAEGWYKPAPLAYLSTFQLQAGGNASASHFCLQFFNNPFMSPLSVLYVAFPFLILFFLHETEEAVALRRRMSKSPEKPHSCVPALLQATSHFPKLSTATLTFAAIEKSFIILIITTLILAGLLPSVSMQLWSALFIAFSLHLILHIVHAAILRIYLPGLITALITLPFSISILTTFFNIYTPLHLLALAITGTCLAVINRYAVLLTTKFLARKFHKP